MHIQQTIISNIKVILMKNIQDFFFPFYRNNKLHRSIKYQSPKTWNSLKSLKKCNSLKTFKFKLKHILSQKYTI